jgi:virulence-associated protein VagC
MARIATAFWLAGSQAVCLPREFWFEGDELRIERLGALIVLTPIRSSCAAPPKYPGPPPNTTFAGFLGPRPIPARSPEETMAEVKRLFGELAANDNAPLGRAETPAA